MYDLMTSTNKPVNTTTFCKMLHEDLWCCWSVKNFKVTWRNEKVAFYSGWATHVLWISQNNQTTFKHSFLFLLHLLKTLSTKTSESLRCRSELKCDSLACQWSKKKKYCTMFTLFIACVPLQSCLVCLLMTNRGLRSDKTSASDQNLSHGELSDFK